jgi:hypothetical protein
MKLTLEQRYFREAPVLSREIFIRAAKTRHSAKGGIDRKMRCARAPDVRPLLSGIRFRHRRERGDPS